ncbi:PAS domain S-box protein [Anatilimnocola floriformis]|uniref:PAS domain S-box protein n=1 Tax=Anatilimnocola floriformis TaxID=2948575 RepID=UPI0020C26705|nr:PAS domain S-box protein [Anatilimnocola floriformis]
MEHASRHPMELELQERVQEPSLTQERLRSALKHSSHAIVSTDSDGVIRAFNPAAERLFGYAYQDAIGRNISLVLSEPLHAGFDTFPTSHLIASQTREVVGRRNDGSTFAAELTVGVSLSSNRQTFTGSVRDITHEQQQAKVRDAMLSRLYSEKVPLAYVLFGPDFRVADWNLAKSGRSPFLSRSDLSCRIF